MYTYKRFKTSKSMMKAALFLLAASMAALVWIGCGNDESPLTPEEVALAPGGNPGPPGGSDQTSAQVTISGCMETDGEQTFSIAKDSKRTLKLTGSGNVHIRHDFVKTQRNSECGADPLLCKLRELLVDPKKPFPIRLHVTIRVDMANLYNVDNGHHISVITEIPEGNVRLWVPEDPLYGRNTEPVTVKLIEDTGPDVSPRVRKFEFISDTLQVWITGPRGEERKLRCVNLDGSIYVTVRTL